MMMMIVMMIVMMFVIMFVGVVDCIMFSRSGSKGQETVEDARSLILFLASILYRLLYLVSSYNNFQVSASN